MPIPEWWSRRSRNLSSTTISLNSLPLRDITMQKSLTRRRRSVRHFSCGSTLVIVTRRPDMFVVTATMIWRPKRKRFSKFAAHGCPLWWVDPGAQFLSGV